MIHDGIEFHGIEHLEPEAGGRLLQRVPEAVRAELNERAQEQMRTTGNAELRFVADKWPVRVRLSGQGAVWPFFGDCWAGPALTLTDEPAWHEIVMPPPLERFLDEVPTTGGFSPRLCRLRPGTHARVVYHGVEGEGVRPPVAGELPVRTLLAYGTSITHGATATAPYLTYPAQAAWRLGLDLVNLGSGGSAHCEPELADWIAGRDDWHMASLALSVNMGAFDDDAFERRVRYMVETVAGADPSRPVAAITLWPYSNDLPGGDPRLAGGRRDILRRVVEEAGLANLHLLEGPEILTRFDGLTGDLIHPPPLGMIEMGEKLAERLGGLID